MKEQQRAAEARELQEQKPRRKGYVARTVAAFSLGAAVGAGVALLMAPASGKETRRRIGKKFQKIGRGAQRKLEQTRKILIARAGKVQHQAAESFEQAREWVTERMQLSNGHSRNGNGKSRRPVRHAHA